MGAKLRERTRMTPSLSSPEWPEPLRKLAKNAAQLRNVVALKLQYRKGGREWQSSEVCYRGFLQLGILGTIHI